ncbi:hypothetical protein PSYPI_19151 [Pseudomonas syringae pv. pisi str. 1704B]|uniref:Uncharacterized protein n=1 Tax=Pseudomonas syringae pv. pisi str. 1704B TaxID=629263 RepID=F3GBD9_PSESJ|nr:hypothetical protein PSYPI_19151 [Pseudomonas syringae pv. pisi str. 1704B]
MYGQAAIGACVDHRTDAAVLVAGDGRQIDLDQRTADPGITQTATDVVPSSNIAEFKPWPSLFRSCRGLFRAISDSGLLVLS